MSGAQRPWGWAPTTSEEFMALPVFTNDDMVAAQAAGHEPQGFVIVQDMIVRMDEPDGKQWHLLSMPSGWFRLGARVRETSSAPGSQDA